MRGEGRPSWQRDKKPNSHREEQKVPTPVPTSDDRPGGAGRVPGATGDAREQPAEAGHAEAGNPEAGPPRAHTNVPTGLLLCEMDQFDCKCFELSQTLFCDAK